MSFTPEFLDELRHRLPVSQVVGRHVQLKRQGREFIGLSPFNKERSPSFTVNDQKQFYHCFSSGKHGDIISFVMDVEGLSFPEAVEALAGQAGLEVPKPTREQAERAERAKTLHDVCEAACAFFQRSLSGPEGRQAREYIEGRGLDAAAVEQFRLGYAPSDRQALRRTLTDQGYTDDLMVEAGLVKRSDYGDRDPFSFFSDRLLFPVSDRRGRVVAFGGRLLNGDGPKYLNSPDTPLFHKSKLLYHMDGARSASAKGHTVIVVEGYMDVIALVRAGFGGAVAPLGTALTEDQVAEAWRIAGTGGAAPILCFDGDNAGQRAAFRAVERVLPHLAPDKTVRFATMPPGEDPDSLLKAGGKQQLLTCLDGAESLVDKVWQLEIAERRLSTPESWAGLRAAIDKRVNSIAHEDLRSFYRQELQSRLKDANYQQRQSQRSGGRGSYSGGGRFEPAIKPKRVAATTPLGLRLVLKTVVNHPALIDDYHDELCALPFADPAFASFRDTLIDAWSADHEIDAERLNQAIQEAGLIDVLQRLQSGQGIEFVAFARADASLRTAKAGLKETLASLHAQSVASELGQAARVLANGGGDGRPGDLDRWHSLNQEVVNAKSAAAHHAETAVSDPES